MGSVKIVKHNTKKTKKKSLKKNNKIKINPLKKTWIVLLFISSSLFLVVGTAKILFDQEYLIAMRYIVAAIVFSITIHMIKHKNYDPSLKSHSSIFSLGFTFLILGTNFYNIGVWAVGFIFFLAAILGVTDHKENDKLLKTKKASVKKKIEYKISKVKARKKRKK